MNFDLILRKAKIVLSSGVIEGDLGITDGKIAKIGVVAEKGKIEKACSGLHVLPGAIDMHVHFRDPGFPEKEDFHTGSCAAAAGGITTVVDMPNTSPPTLTCEALEAKRAVAAAKSVVNYGFYMALSEDNLEEIKRAKNIAGVKLFLGSTTGNLLVQKIEAIEQLLKLRKFVITHAENEDIIKENAAKFKDAVDPKIHSLIRSPRAAYEAVKFILHLAKKLDAKIHITHVSTAGEVDELQKFKGPNVSADATTHHLYLTDAAYAERGNFVKMNPPLRSEDDRQALWKALKDGTIQVVATDHAPHTKAEKEQPHAKAPSGVPGEETLLPLLLNSVNSGDLNLNDVCRLVCENPAKLLQIPNKGKIEEGFDADLTIVDMNLTQAVGAHGYFTKCGWSPFDGWKLKGWPVMTIVGGAVVFENGKVQEAARGQEVIFAQVKNLK